MNIIKELWHGKIVSQDVRHGLASLRASSRTNSKEMKELLGYMARHHEDLEKTFTEKQKEIFDKFHVARQKQLSVVFCRSETAQSNESADPSKRR